MNYSYADYYEGKTSLLKFGSLLKFNHILKFR